jgi:hypothetical protein
MVPIDCILSLGKFKKVYHWPPAALDICLVFYPCMLQSETDETRPTLPSDCLGLVHTGGHNKQAGLVVFAPVQPRK